MSDRNKRSSLCDSKKKVTPSRLICWRKFQQWKKPKRPNSPALALQMQTHARDYINSTSSFACARRTGSWQRRGKQATTPWLIHAHMPLFCLALKRAPLALCCALSSSLRNMHTHKFFLLFNFWPTLSGSFSFHVIKRERQPTQQAVKEP